MARHQIIYTSCMRGIDGVNDGQQVYSYDALFTDSKSDEVRSLFSYQIPSLSNGVVMNEEIALTMPSAFSYRYFDSNKSAITLNTYLGRDYMGEGGRFGNQLSHSIICDEEDFNIYPCELYGTESLRSSMKYEEVNNPNLPEYLPEPILDRGYKVDKDSVIEFLGLNNNFNYYKNMLYALLRFKEDKKRILICDEPDNIIMWIAALEYAFPLDVVKKINFTTYEYDPDLSAAQICGVVSEGTKYDIARYEGKNCHFIFDFIAESFEEFDVSNSYFDFVNAAMSFNYNSLVDFHTFISNNFCYQKLDTSVLDAYSLYEIELNGMEDINKERFKGAINFLNQYGNLEVKSKFIHLIIENASVIDKVNYEYALNIIGFLLESYENLDETDKETVKQLIINRILTEFSDREVQESEFILLFDTIDSLAKKIHVNFASELMKNKNRDYLFEIMESKVDSWKINFIIRIISEYVIVDKISIDYLYPDKSIGSLYYGIIKSVYKSGREDGLKLVGVILEQFSKDSIYLINMVFNVEGCLSDIELDKSDIEHLWNKFFNIVVSMSENEVDYMYNQLSEYSRYDEIFNLYKSLISKERLLSDKRKVFMNVFKNWFSKDNTFAEKYIEKVMNVYANNLFDNSSSSNKEELEKYKQELLKLSIDKEVKADYVDLLIIGIVNDMPLEEPETDDEELLTDIVNYQCNFRKEKLEGKLLLITVGMLLDRIDSTKDFIKIIEKIKTISSLEGADLLRVDEKSVYKYFEWILSNITKYGVKSDDMKSIFDLFKMTKSMSHKYMELSCQKYYKICKINKDYSAFCEFISFMFKSGDYLDRENVGKILCKLSKQKMKVLDDQVKLYFKKEIKNIKLWKEIVQVAGSTNPILNSISNLIKRIKI